MRISDWSSDVCSSDLVSPPSPGSEGLSGTVEPPSSMLPSTRPRTASEASPAVTRPSPLLSRPLFHWYSMLPLDHRVELGSDFGEPYSPEVYTPSSVDRRSEEHTSELPYLITLSY